MNVGSMILAFLFAKVTTVLLWFHGVAVGWLLLAFPAAGSFALLAIAFVKHIVDTTPPKK
jgi:hypothetical protein